MWRQLRCGSLSPYFGTFWFQCIALFISGKYYCFAFRYTILQHKEYQYEANFQIRLLPEKLWYSQLILFQEWSRSFLWTYMWKYSQIDLQSGYYSENSIQGSFWLLWILDMSFETTTLSSLHGLDEPRTPLGSPSENHVLSTEVQPGVGFDASMRLVFSDVLRAGFAAWAPPSASLTQRQLRRTLVLSTGCCFMLWYYKGFMTSSISV